MTDDEMDGARSAALDTVLLLLLRELIAEVYFHEDPAVYRRRLATLEERVIGEVSTNPELAGTDAASTYARESASALVSNIVASIAHPTDRTGDG